MKTTTFILLAVLAMSCYKTQTTKQCSTQWDVLHEAVTPWMPSQSTYSWVAFEVPEAGTGVLQFYAELDGEASQGPRWEFVPTAGEAWNNSDTYQSFYNEEDTFFSAWGVLHNVTFESTGTLWVQKYNYFTVNEKVCLAFTPTTSGGVSK